MPIEIDWEEVMPTTTAASSSSSSHGDDFEVRFVSTSTRSSVAQRLRPRGARTEEEAEIVRMKDDELRREMAFAGRLRPRFEGILCDGGEGNRRRRALLEAEARRRWIGPAAKDGDDRHSASRDVFSFDIEDQLGEDASRKFCGKPWPVSSTKENYGQLGIETRRSSRQIEQRKPISVDKMYSSKPCSSTLSGHKLRVHAIDPDEKADDEKSEPSTRYSFRNYIKKRKEKHQSCLSDFQKVQDVVLLDDEDVQPEGQVDCGMHDRRNETMIYYPSRDDPEAVELSSSDIKCLDPGVYLSSPVINFYIQYMKRTKLHDDDCREKFYIFNTYFYSKLEEALLGKGEFLKLRRWWKGVNIYHTSYIILPIHGTAHWSLIIICIPSKESNSGPIILHLDSLELHSSAKIFDTVRRYLEAEWCHLRKNPPLDISISDTIWDDLPSNIQKEKVQVPQQKNEYDCGIFMLYYIERFIRLAPERFTRDNLSMFSRSWFQPEDASDLRQRIRELLLEEFESARLDEALSEADTSDRSDNEEDATKSAESEQAAAAAAAPGSGSSEMIVEGGDTGTSNEDIKGVAASKEASSSICRSADNLAGCVLLEEATLSDSVMKDEEDTTKADPVSSQDEQEVAVLSPGAWKNSEENTHKQPQPDICCDSSDSEMDDVKIIEDPYQRTNKQNCRIF
uniref:Ubiquitin-like protease family profile domain-containing protein n=1 Tax=Oryza meridionalis TaxID=40149 RepID=A0A0E0FDZ5_9ORYZ